MSSYTTDHKYGGGYASIKTAGKLKYCNSLCVFNKTIIPLALIGYEIVITSASGIIVNKPEIANQSDCLKHQDH